MEGRVRVGQDHSSGQALLVQSGSVVASLPLAHVSEILRSLPLEPAPHAPFFVSGVSILRGEPVPIVDLGRVLGRPGGAHPKRLVSLKLGARRVALAVDAVLGVVPETAFDRHELPPLLGGASQGAVGEIATLDRQFLAILETSRLVPESLSPAAPPGGGTA